MSEKKISVFKDIGALIISIILAEGVGFLAGTFTRGADIYYRMLKRPPFAPPPWIFGIVWPVLYLLMAVAVYRVWLKRREGNGVNSALVLYIIQLILNFLWPILFFRLNLYGLSFIELVILTIFVLLTTIKFFRIDKFAGLLMLPYLAWLIFAGLLNYSIWLLNEA
ncbi:MAG: TspO/MBR family protein [Bacillota bacterium]|nr:TspO/MBR family protein [Bacillota bacterium]